MSQPIRWMAAAWCVPALLVAQDAPRGPVFAHIFDSEAGLIRPLFGVPGSAAPGDPLSFTGPLRAAAVAASQQYALAVARDDGAVLLVAFDGEGSVRPVAGAIAAPDRVALSPRGTAAVLYYAADRRIDVVTGLPSQPAVSAGFPAPEFAISVLAVSDDGASVITGSASGWVRIVDGASEPPIISREIAAARYLAGSRDALVVDRANRAILRYPAAGPPEILASSEDGVDGPVDAWWDVSSGRLAVINGERGEIVLIDPAGGARSRRVIACECRGVALEPARFGWFRIADGLLFDPATARIVFIPRPAPSGGN